MNLYPVFIFFLFLQCFIAFRTAFCNPTRFTGDDVSVDCGSSGTFTAQSGREWCGDVQKKFAPFLHVRGSSTTSSVSQRFVYGDNPVPYRTARVSRSQFSYVFQVNPGQKIIRLHFNSASYKGFKRYKDFFTVKAAAFTLLSNFSASFTADAHGVNNFVKEFCLNLGENKLLDLTFSASNHLSDAYAFINGIEIISVPASRSYFHMENIGVQVVGESPIYMDSSTAFEIISRTDIKRESVSSSLNDAAHIFGMWEKVHNRKVNKINNVTWKISVDVGFRYLVRLHYSDLGLKMAENNVLRISIDDMIVDTKISAAIEKDDEASSIRRYRDYALNMKGCKQEGKRNLLIYLESKDEFVDENGPLEGFEVLKLSNLENSLASPNPVPSTQDSSYQMFKNLIQVFGHENAIATLLIVLLSVVNVIVYMLKMIREAESMPEENMPSARATQLCRRFSLAEIQLATRNFSEGHLIGRGGFGKVYRGVVDNGKLNVAIKRLKQSSKQGAAEFLTEIETLTELRHVNLVSLVGFCKERGEMILVYSLMTSGTLADHLYKHARNGRDSLSLNWKQRLNICIGAARGLDYLHAGHSVIHRDVKASNILLDDNITAKISDFGLAKHLHRSSLHSHISTKVKGTVGYFDPKYLITGKLTKKSDTYAFGVVLLEVLCGRPALDRTAAEDEHVLIKWARESISKGQADRIVASNLQGEITAESLKVFVGIAERCLHDEPKNRPSMSQVVAQLEFALEQQDNLISLGSNEIVSDLDDVHQANGEANVTGGGEQPRSPSADSPDVTPPPAVKPEIEMVKDEPVFGKEAEPSSTKKPEPQPTKKDEPKKDARKASTHKQSRGRTWETFWNKIKPSSKTEKQPQSNSVENIAPVAAAMVESEAPASNLPVILAPVIPLETIKEITFNFGTRCFIGEGSYARVYRGVLKNGRAAAIKKLDSSSQPNQEFLSQVATVSSLKHENVIELLGYCVDDNLRVLAYEYAPNGSLHQLLHGRAGPEQARVLSWGERVKIAICAAKGLQYIHDKSQMHCDISSGMR
ncbi:putative receptor-like protein kinase At5g39000 isoform X2 [Andrographis paniculata]|uniref:putative receptor-like protein kinase At5g39000 isoform X2 n=1 Tax=Andrographis paniculata TaxID=175694 RepID=UPI0021E8CE8C|nr:putative receptor-like protein kinase At5g39000 isoform X2 [Andrographis paniculata]